MNTESDLNRARVMIVTDKHYALVQGCYYSYGGTQKEFEALSKVCDLSVLVSVEECYEIPKGYEQLSEGIKVYSNGYIRYWNALPALWIMFRTFVRVVRLQKRYRFDIIVGKAPREVGMAAVFAARATGCHSIFHYSYNWIPEVKENKGYVLNALLWGYRAVIWSYRKRLLGVVCRRADQTATVSTEFARQLASLSGIPLCEISLLRTTFTLQDVLFDLDPLTDQTPTNVLFVGRMDSNKNVETLLRGFSLAKSQGFDGALLLAGNGPEFERLQRLAGDLNLTDAARFLGYVGNDQLATLLEKSLVLVLPSFSEGFPKVLLEAGAAARPLLGSAIDGNKEIIEPGRNGYLFDPADHRDLARQLVKITERQTARTMGLAARAMVAPYRPREAIKYWRAAFEKGFTAKNPNYFPNS